ncbi:7153_t:CDS:1 [Scutellospora calospora]|uniref:7153_t:CDS:1 n=1 Tax=Scutellospora calospora TaxID=85575 RepID=A0ACA9NCV2_9GLOM|nr:7153_t:CDS:1 [Scutellospora calospora]
MYYAKKKNENSNITDNLVANQSTKTNNQKQYHECGKNKIENSKRKYPQYNAKLPSLAETQQENEQTIIKTKDSTKPLIFRPYKPNTSISDKFINPISITQKFKPQDSVNISDILVPDPLPINPNSIDNVRKVLDHIQKICRISSGIREWIVVVCDGIPYHYVQKFKNKYPKIILLPGPLHEKMNMLKAFVELNWYNVKY